jgi:hypothetical protein
VAFAKYSFAPPSLRLEERVKLAHHRPRSLEAPVAERHARAPNLARNADVKTLSQSTRLAKIDNDRIIFEEVIEKDRGLTSKTPSPLSTLDAALTADISAVSQIDAVASILEAARCI